MSFARKWRNLHGNPTIANAASSTCFSGACCRPMYGSAKSQHVLRDVLLRIRHSRAFVNFDGGQDVGGWGEYQGLMSAKPSRKHRKQAEAYQRSEIKRMRVVELVRELGRTTASSSSKARPPPQFEFGQSVLGSMDVGGNGRTARQPPSKMLRV